MQRLPECDVPVPGGEVCGGVEQSKADQSDGWRDRQRSDVPQQQTDQTTHAQEHLEQ